MKISFASLIAVPVLAFSLLACTLALCPPPASAQDRDAGVAEGTTGRETEFVAMTGPARESVPGGALLVSAYAVIWLLLCGYVGRLALLQMSTSKDLARLEAVLRAKDSGEPGAAKAVAAPSKAAKGKSEKAK